VWILDIWKCECI